MRNELVESGERHKNLPINWPERSSIPYPTSWEQLDLSAEIDTPEKRFAAALNIIQNGAQSLAVMAMHPDPQYFEDYTVINRRLNSLARQKVVGSTATKGHLSHTIGPLGVAATTDERQWALNEFGITLRAGIVFAWQNFLDLYIDPMDSLGANSDGKRDENGGNVTTSAEVRARILAALAEKGELRVVDLVEPTGVSQNALGEVTDKLHGKEIIKKKNKTPSSGEDITYYTVVDPSISEWPTYIDGRGVPYAISADFAKGLLALYGDRAFTTDEAHKAIPSYNQPFVSAMLAFYARHGALKRGEFHLGMQSTITLLPVGELVVQEILSPLLLWCKDPTAVQTILRIGKQLENGTFRSDTLWADMAASFELNSPAKNRDKAGKIASVKSLIYENPGMLTRADIARLMGFSSSSAARSVAALIASGEIQERESAIGPHMLLFPNGEKPAENDLGH